MVEVIMISENKNLKAWGLSIIRLLKEIKCFVSSVYEVMKGYEYFI